MPTVFDEQDQWDDLLEEIERLKEEGLVKLRKAGLPKERYEEAADKIINILALLPVVDDLYAQVEEFLAKPRTQHSQARLAGLTAYIIDLVEEAIRQIVRNAIEQTVSEYKNPPPPPKEPPLKEIVIEPPKPWYERLMEFFFEDQEQAESLGLVLLGVLFGAWVLFSLVVFDSYWWVWAFLIPILLALCFTAGWLGRIVAFFIAVVAVIALF